MNRLEPSATKSAATLAALLSVSAAGAALAGESPTIVEIKNLALQQMAVQGFSLPAEQSVRVEGVGFQRSEAFGELSRAWILDAGSRRVVWDTAKARLTGRGRETRQFDDEVRLPAGDYEAYFSTYPSSAWLLDDDLEWWQMVRSKGLGLDDFKESVKDLRLAVHGRGSARALPASGRASDPRVVVSLVDPALSSKRVAGFALTRPTRVEVYGVGEVTEDGQFDYGWITDLASRKQVWTMAYDNTEAAGGAKKNRRVRTQLDLPTGRYAATFVTDDTHSSGKWNAQPPADPFYWGLTVRVVDPGTKAQVSTFAVDEQGDRDVIAQIVKVGDGECRTVGFSLRRPLDVRIYALGEGSGGEMVDYGWLADAKTRRKVWTMSWEGSEAAGGAAKNRAVDQVVPLPAGSYLLNYVSDGSHSYKDWNSAAPADREHWGVTIYAAAPGFDRQATVAPYVEAEDGDTLVDLTRVGDDAERKARFKLDAPARLRIIALGEGVGGEMVDYGWVEDARGKAVWEMTYRMTDPGGGASKNRQYEGTLELAAGEYTAHFVTDGSHSFGDFNDDPPSDPTAWGLRIVRVE
jgi:hypothetical protein